ncbi:NucA/NucB deoxyribonuclease domain-containing protein [Streptomyces sp. M2CJ-2]|uniref:NucA/NucB deoxyribonuclease domain-containing protein n=1 Tax=Streptomyces sp. M2CJ-2 TaxID=2803948 RepID=UPI0034D79D5B
MSRSRTQQRDNAERGGPQTRLQREYPRRPGGGGGKDCDEYPFRSSAEGAARYKYEGDEFKDDFSVRYIIREENQEAGRRLGAWYHSDRILDWEAFTVTIGDWHSSSDTPVNQGRAVPIRGRPCGPFDAAQAVAVRQI